MVACKNGYKPASPLKQRALALLCGRQLKTIRQNDTIRLSIKAPFPRKHTDTNKQEKCGHQGLSRGKGDGLVRRLSRTAIGANPPARPPPSTYKKELSAIRLTIYIEAGPTINTSIYTCIITVSDVFLNSRLLLKQACFFCERGRRCQLHRSIAQNQAFHLPLEPPRPSQPGWAPLPGSATRQFEDVQRKQSIQGADVVPAS